MNKWSLHCPGPPGGWEMLVYQTVWLTAHTGKEQKKGFHVFIALKFLPTKKKTHDGFAKTLRTKTFSTTNAHRNKNKIKKVFFTSSRV